MERINYLRPPGHATEIAPGRINALSPIRAGDVVVFRGDQRHSYLNVGAGEAVGYSVVMLNPPQSWGAVLPG